MQMLCDKCSDHLWHTHCESCEHFMSQLLDECPKCGWPTKSKVNVGETEDGRDRASLPWWLRN